MRTKPKRAKPGWAACWSAAAPHRRVWTEGWDTAEACPPSLRRRARVGWHGRAVEAAPGGAWREVGACGGRRWRELHADRAAVVEMLRRAGYVQRHRWPRVEKGTRKHGKAVVADWRYTEGAGALAGLPAIDAWSVARRLAACAADWRINLRQRRDTTLTAAALPAACGLGHVCPLCAAGRASTRARALRTVLAHLHAEQPAALALATLTQQARRGEGLAQAQGRLRDGLERCWRGRPGRRLRAFFAGWWTGLEVTFNAKTGWWHAHAHLIVRLHTAVSEDKARVALAQVWQAASAAAAEEGGQPGAGWMPYAGGVADGDEGCSGGWWKSIDPASPEEVYQACKYPTPITQLDAEHFAEFLAVAHGRRWHYGAGNLQRVSALAAELDENGGDWTTEEVRRPTGDGQGEDTPAIDLGKSVSSMAPRDAPRLDHIAPGYGLHGQYEPPEPTEGEVLFKLANSAIVAVAAVVEGYGGELARHPTGAWWAILPRAWVSRETWNNAEALRLRRLNTEQN